MSELEQLKMSDRAWKEVWATLLDYNPDFHMLPRKGGRECAIAEIKRLQASESRLNRKTA